MMIPYIVPQVPQMIPIGIGSPAIGNYGSPIYGNIGSPIVGHMGNPGLIHSGPGIGNMLQPIYRSQMFPYGYGYGYGLLHSGPEIPGYGPIGYGGYGNYGPIGYGPIGYNPAIQMQAGMQGINQGGIPGFTSPPLQPAWSGGLGNGI